VVVQCEGLSPRDKIVSERDDPDPDPLRIEGLVSAIGMNCRD